MQIFVSVIINIKNENAIIQIISSVITFLFKFISRLEVF